MAVCSTLRIQLLGGFGLVDDEGSIKAVSSTALQLLLTYLLLNRHAPQSRQHISFLLWPDSSDSQAQANLRTLLARLRRAWPKVERFLHIDYQMLQWRADAGEDRADDKVRAKDRRVPAGLHRRRQNPRDDSVHRDGHRHDEHGHGRNGFFQPYPLLAVAAPAEGQQCVQLPSPGRAFLREVISEQSNIREQLQVQRQQTGQNIYRQRSGIPQQRRLLPGR